MKKPTDKEKTTHNNDNYTKKHSKEMIDEISIKLAGILGPVLMIVSSSEFLNFNIWNKVDSTVVALNGMILLIFGITIISFHNIWAVNWTVIITIIGWMLFLTGIYRMFFPNGKQAKKGRITNFFLLFIFLIGLFLSYKSFTN